jgi:hypothetical protein
MHVLSRFIRLGVSSLFRLEVSSLFRMDVSMLFSRPLQYGRFAIFLTGRPGLRPVIKLAICWRSIMKLIKIGESSSILTNDSNNNNKAKDRPSFHCMPTQVKKTENHFSPYPRFQGNINLYTACLVNCGENLQ